MAAETFQEFVERVNLICAIDHSGRAGNGFFQTIFDQHPEVLTCPWMHYAYSYAATEFGETASYDADKVRARWPETVYYKLLYADETEAARAFIHKFGGDPDVAIDRARVRGAFDAILRSRRVITRKELIAATYFSFAAGMGRETRQVRYILTTDSITLRTEKATEGFSGRIIDLVLGDYPDARIVHLIRDPRAGFASTNHQFVNQLGNMYGIRFGNYWKRLCRLLRKDFDWDSVFVFGFWLIYFRQAFEAVRRKRDQYPDRFLTVRNEDLNLSFERTMKELATRLEVAWQPVWRQEFRPTMLGKPWMGTGGYNNRYQRARHGPLPNDRESVSNSLAGPNEYVTRRWMTRLSRREMRLIEWALLPEFEAYGYECLEWGPGDRQNSRLFRAACLPLRGELPTLRWLYDGRHGGFGEVMQRLFYSVSFPLFYVCARASMYSFARTTGIFRSSTATS